MSGYEITQEMMDIMWQGAYIAVLPLCITFMWCLACAIVNKGVGG